MTRPLPTYRSATRDDIPAIASLIGPHVAARTLLPRDEEDLAHLVPNGFVAEASGSLIGFAAVEIYSSRMAEVLCLAVADTWQGHGIGKQLVTMCVERAEERNVRELMVISSSEIFFRACGFDFTLPNERKALFIQTGSGRAEP